MINDINGKCRPSLHLPSLQPCLGHDGHGRSRSRHDAARPFLRHMAMANIQKT